MPIHLFLYHHTNTNNDSGVAYKTNSENVFETQTERLISIQNHETRQKMVRLIENLLLISFAVSILAVKSLASDVPIHNDILVITIQR